MVTSYCPASARPIARVQEVSRFGAWQAEGDFDDPLPDVYFRALLMTTTRLLPKDKRHGRNGERYSVNIWLCLLLD